MRRSELQQEIRKMRFEEAYDGWQEKRLSQEEASRLLGICDRTFRRYIDRYHENGIEGLIDKRLEQVSHRRAPVDEVVAVIEKYKRDYEGWNVKHYYGRYRRRGGSRSYTWVKQRLQEKGLVPKAPGRGKHRKKRTPMPLPGMMIHQDGITHEWVPGQTWDLVVTMDDATNEHYDMVFVKQEGTSYSPEARGRSERAFRTHQERLPKELVLACIKDMEAANRYLGEVYKPEFNKEFRRAPAVRSRGGAWGFLCCFLRVLQGSKRLGG